MSVGRLTPSVWATALLVAPGAAQARIIRARNAKPWAVIRRRVQRSSASRDPATGACACLYRSVTTVAHRATAADALSTAFSLMPRDRIQSVMRRAGIQMVYMIDDDGTPSRLEA